MKVHQRRLHISARGAGSTEALLGAGFTSSSSNPINEPEGTSLPDHHLDDNATCWEDELALIVKPPAGE